MKIKEIIPKAIEYCTCPENVIETLSSLCRCNNYEEWGKYLKNKFNKLKEGIDHMDKTLFQVQMEDIGGIFKTISSWEYQKDAENEIEAILSKNPLLRLRLIQKVTNTSIVYDSGSFASSGVKFNTESYGAETLFGT